MSTNQPEQRGGSSTTDAKSKVAAVDVQVQQEDMDQHQQGDINKLNGEIDELKKEETRLSELNEAANSYLETLNEAFGEHSQQEPPPESSTEPPVEESSKDELQKVALTQVASDSGLEPSSNSRMLDFEVTVEKGHIQEIKYENAIVWHFYCELLYMDEQKYDTLKVQANKLLTDGKINPDLLREFILECHPKSEREHESICIQQVTDHYATCANQTSLHNVVQASTSEMFLQQAIYPPISLLLHLFAFGVLSSSDYAAGQEILCAHSLKNKGTQIENCFKGCPDAAVRLCASFYVVATMEIKAGRGFYQDGLAKCILLTSMSLVAYHKWSQNHCRLASCDIEGMQLPFVVGSAEKAYLYVTSLNRSNDQLTPKVERVYIADMSNRTRRIEFVSRLAVLLKRAVTVVLENRPDWYLSYPEHLPQIISGSSSNQERSTKDSNARTGSESGSRSTKASNQSTGSESGSISASHAETSAKQALISVGHLTNVMYPWDRVRWLAFNAKEARQAEFEFYRQQSPFYFVGHFTADGQKEPEAVFCKVWKDGDRKTNRQEIIEEIEHLRLANKLGVPSPKVVEQATRLDLKLPTPSLDSSTYHILTMTKAKTDDVTRCDVLDYAVSLIQTVRMLHKQAGILHCDIKPANVSWNADQHKVLLLDFGHAQSELNAKSYLGTTGFEAPEVLDDKPHTQASDAYSVGITLQKVIESVDRPNSNHRSSDAAGLTLQVVADVAKGLTHDSPDQRLTLDQAEISLTSNYFRCSSNEDSQPRKKSRIA